MAIPCSIHTAANAYSAASARGAAASACARSFSVHFPIRVAGKPVLIEEQHRAVADEQIGRVFERGGLVVQDARGFIDESPAFKMPSAHLQFSGQDIGMSTGEVLVPRRDVALFPMVQRGPGAGLAPDHSTLTLDIGDCSIHGASERTSVS